MKWIDLYATDPDELERLWKWQAKNAGGPLLSSGNIPHIQQAHCEITDKLCRAMGKLTAAEAAKEWFAKPGVKNDGPMPYTGELRAPHASLRKAAESLAT